MVIFEEFRGSSLYNIRCIVWNDSADASRSLVNVFNREARLARHSIATKEKRAK